MTIPAYTGMETALRGLQAAQMAIDTTGQNIANANNASYTRQVVNLSETPGLNLPASSASGQTLQLGQGVDVASISRIRDQFLDIQYRAQNSNTSGSETTTTLLTQAQAALAEPSSGGVSEQLTAFWNAWSDLANSPTSLTAKQNVVEAATTLTGTFNSVVSQLSSLQSQAAAQLGSLTASNGPVQNDANQIATLNSQISKAMGAGQTPNDLLDQRDKLLDDLSQYGNVSVSDSGNGLITVNFGGDTSTPLVAGAAANPVSSLALSTTSGGSVGALESLSGPTGQIAGYLSTLGTFASTLTAAVNAVHATPPFFAVSTAATPQGSTATTLSVNPALTADASQVQATASSNSAANEVALGVAQLAGGTVDQSYSAFISKVGSDLSNASSTQSTARSLLTAVGNQRQSVSGVSLDEEMTNLIQYQRAYQASARVMTTIDSVLDQLINHTGTVGL
jgi:flagellar hook-associated protein 1 FlgK